MRYTPKKKKVHGPSVVGAMKRVRIDNRTEIMVDVTIPDEVARERYLARMTKIVKGPHVPAKKAIDSEALNGEEIPIGSLEEIQEMVADNTELVEED